MGPNGHAILAAHLDAASLLQYSEDRNRLFRWMTLTGQTKLLERLIFVMSRHSQIAYQQELHPGRLGFIPEGGGKTRQIAIADYFTQESLKSLFKGLMDILRNLESDGTYNQRTLADSMKQAALSLKPIHCFDLTQATDRFPIKIQENLLATLIGKTRAKA